MWTKIAATLVLLLALAVAVGGPATQPASTPAGRPKVIPLFEDLTVPGAADKQLDTILKEVTFDSLPLEQALKALGEQAHLNIVPYRGALEAAGYEMTAPVTLHLKEVTAREALTAISLSHSTTEHLVFVARGNLVLFGPESALSGQKVTRLYDIGDLIVSERERTWALLPVEENTVGPSTEETIEKIVSALLLAVRDRWTDIGGQSGPVQEFNGRLFITETPESHRKIEEVLAALRATAKVPAAPPATKPGGEGEQGADGRNREQSGSLKAVPYEDLLVGNPFTFDRLEEEMKRNR